MIALSKNINIAELEYYAKIELSKQCFWNFCKTLSPDFYKDERHHLKELCEKLQAFYERKIIKLHKDDDWQIVDIVPDEYYSTCERLMINMPPRMGKSRTLVNFSAWVFGKNTKEKIITCSYNDGEAQDFSRYTRDMINEEGSLVDCYDIVYSDIFPNTKIKRGDASYKQWALDQHFFSYKGTGLQGSLTGKGGSILIIDDPIKDAETAFNENALKKIWQWYTGTFLSRKEENALEIINHTRWAANDPCGRILQDKEEASNTYVYKLEAYDSKNDKMLCPELLSKKSYNEKRKLMDDAIFNANFHQEPIDKKGRLYKNLRLYDRIPKDDNGNILFNDIINYTDTADQGNDYLCSIVAGVYLDELYILDVIYTLDGMEITEPQTASFLNKNNVNISFIESNNGGRGFARNVTSHMMKKHRTNKTRIIWFWQSKNKKSRILTSSSFIINHCYFPRNWSDKWPEFFRDVVGWQKDVKNAHDDAPDALSGLAEMINNKIKIKAGDTSADELGL